MGRRKHYSDEGASLFDDPSPLSLPEFSLSEITTSEKFLQNSRETLGYVSEIYNTLIKKIAKGEQPNYTLLKALNDLTRTITQAMTSYDGLTKIETKDNTKPISEVSINIVAKEP